MNPSRRAQVLTDLSNILGTPTDIPEAEFVEAYWPNVVLSKQKVIVDLSAEEQTRLYQTIGYCLINKVPYRLIGDNPPLMAW